MKEPEVAKKIMMKTEELMKRKRIENYMSCQFGSKLEFLKKFQLDSKSIDTELDKFPIDELTNKIYCNI